MNTFESMSATCLIEQMIKHNEGSVSHADWLNCKVEVHQRTVREWRSGFESGYGCLRMIQLGTGERLLQMERSCEEHWFGPLTDEQAQAFIVLHELKMIGDEE